MARVGTKARANGALVTWYIMYEYPSDLPAVIPPGDRKDLDADLLTDWQRLDDDIAKKWESEDPEDRHLDDLALICNYWVLAYLGRLRDVCMTYLSEHKRPIDEAARRVTEEVIHETKARVVRQPYRPLSLIEVLYPKSKGRRNTGRITFVVLPTMQRVCG